jgi:hypothetical protein
MEKEIENLDKFLENYVDENFDEIEEKPISCEELKSELEKISLETKNKCGSR